MAKRCHSNFGTCPSPDRTIRTPRTLQLPSQPIGPKAGINVSLQTVDWQRILTAQQRTNAALHARVDRRQWRSRQLCLLFFLPGRQRLAKASDGFVADKELSDLLKKAAALTDKAERTKLYGQAEKMIFDKALRVFVAHNQPPLAFLANVEGYIANPTSSEYFNTVVVK